MSNTLADILRGMVIESSNPIRRKCFISYCAGDTKEVEKFINDFGDVFIPKVIGITDKDDFIDSNDSGYVMSKIREKYLGDSSVTICLIGSCTHSRRYIDWELKATLRGGSYTPNGLIGIVLPSLGGSAHLPPRFKQNWNKEDSSKGYATYYSYPSSKEALRKWIEDAHSRRTSHTDFIVNTQSMHKNNRECTVHKETH